MADPIIPAPAGADDQPSFSAIAQYIKDLSVESPSAPTVFSWNVQPQLDVQFNIAVNQVGDGVHEVILRIEVKAASDQGSHFLVDLSYGGLFGLSNIPDDSIAPFVLIEAPRLLFPFARQIVAEAVQNLGFPPLLLDPIDFAGAYMAQAEVAGDAPVANGAGQISLDAPVAG